MFFKKYAFYILLSITLLGFIFFFLIQKNLVSIHLFDLKNKLEQAEIKENSLDHIWLVAKYKIHKKLYENKIEQQQADHLEFRSLSIINELKLNNKTENPVFFHSISHVINFIRIISGKEPLATQKSSNLNLYLTIAYYYERNRQYQKALTFFKKALEQNNKQNYIKASILLHMGYSCAITGKYKQAKFYYLHIIQNYAKENLVLTATILLSYLEDFNKEIKKVLKSKDNKIVKSEKLYQLFYCEESIKILKTISQGNSLQKSKIMYLKGRCNEETGKANDALAFYQKTINLYENIYAQLANIRIYMMGIRFFPKNKLKKIALMNNKKLKDNTLIKLIDFEKKILLLGNSKKFYKTDHFIKNELLKTQTHFKYPELISLNNNRKITKKRKIYQKTKVYTRQNDIFIGQLIKDEKNYIILKNFMGKLKIKKENITKIQILK